MPLALIPDTFAHIVAKKPSLRAEKSRFDLPILVPSAGLVFLGHLVLLRMGRAERVWGLWSCARDMVAQALGSMRREGQYDTVARGDVRPEGGSAVLGIAA